MIPGTGPKIASFVSYAAEKKLARDPTRFGRGAIEGVGSPEAATHSAVQGDFIPTMSLGIPGDAMMALLLALIIQGIQPGPQLMGEHPDIFWGLIASFWIGNILLVIAVFGQHGISGGAEAGRFECSGTGEAEHRRLAGGIRRVCEIPMLAAMDED